MEIQETSCIGTFFDLVYKKNDVEIADNADFSQTFTIEAILP